MWSARSKVAQMIQQQFRPPAAPGTWSRCGADPHRWAQVLIHTPAVMQQSFLTEEGVGWSSTLARRGVEATAVVGNQQRNSHSEKTSKRVLMPKKKNKQKQNPHTPLKRVNRDEHNLLSLFKWNKYIKCLCIRERRRKNDETDDARYITVAATVGLCQCEIMWRCSKQLLPEVNGYYYQQTLQIPKHWKMQLSLCVCICVPNPLPKKKV